MTLETERLRLRELTATDAPFIRRLLTEPSFLEHIGDRGVRTEDDARAYIENGPRASYRDHGFGLLLVELRAGGAPVGLCGLVKRAELEDADVGYAFVPEHWARGYAFEAARAVLTDARERLGLARVIAIVSPGNAASIRLLGKLGFHHERTLRLAGAPSDVLVYA